MKTKVLLFVSLFLLSISLSVNGQDKKKSNKEEVTFDVSMTCENCKKKIEKNIAFEKGVTDMKVDLPEKTVTVKYNTDKTDPAKLMEAFEKLGFNASIHQEETEE